MNLSNRLLKIEQHRPKLIYPTFSDMYSTQTKADYNQWLLDHNVGLTQAMINELNIKHLSEMY